MSDLIGCRSCDAPSCKGCNIYTLAKALEAGRFKHLTDDNHCVHITADVVEVVRCGQCRWFIANSITNSYGWCKVLDNHKEVYRSWYCANGERRGEGELPVVVHRKSRCEWVVIQPLKDWLKIYREAMPDGKGNNSAWWK